MEKVLKMDFFDKVNQAGTVPVVVIDSAECAVPTAQALIRGGISFMEITLRTSCALEAIRLVKENVPEMTVGAGTVISEEQAQAAVAAGASFIVSPGFFPEVVDHCIKSNVPVIPGCVTPTEIISAINKGIKIVKFFPADVYGGIKTIKELSGVFRDIKFLPTGGINASNMAEYISEPSIIAVGGSWVCPSKMIAAHDYDGIELKAKEATDIIKTLKENAA